MHPRDLRLALNLDAFYFAALIGVSISSVYRWEAIPDPEIDPRSRRLIEWGARRLEMPFSQEWIADIHAALRYGSELSALARFLDGCETGALPPRETERARRREVEVTARRLLRSQNR